MKKFQQETKKILSEIDQFIHDPVLDWLINNIDAGKRIPFPKEELNYIRKQICNLIMKKNQEKQIYSLLEKYHLILSVYYLNIVEAEAEAEAELILSHYFRDKSRRIVI